MAIKYKYERLTQGHCKWFEIWQCYKKRVDMTEVMGIFLK